MTNNEEEINAILKELLREAYNEASKHFGQPYFNTATMAGVFRIAIKKLVKEKNSNV